jgi:hypothetical protein
MVMTVFAASVALADTGPGNPTDGTARSGASTATASGDHTSASKHGGGATPDGSKHG